MYIPKHFSAAELVPEKLHAKYKSRGDAWLLRILFDERLLMTIDTIRENFGPMTINDWSWGGANQYRGIRPPDCSIGAGLSQHRFGRAVDMIPKDIKAAEIRVDIIEDQMGQAYKHIGGLEMGISWLHIDTRGRDAEGMISCFYPSNKAVIIPK